MPTTKLLTFSDYAAEITKHAKILDAYIEENDLPQPSFSQNGPLKFPVPNSALAAQASRTAIVEASKSLFSLAAGPTNAIAWPSLTRQFDLLTFRAIVEFDIPASVPLNGTASFASISVKTGLPEEAVARIIRHAATSHIFHEVRAGWVEHTAMSRVLLENLGIRDYIRLFNNEGLTSSLKFNDAVRQYSEFGPGKTPFGLAFSTSGTYYDFIQRPEEAKRLEAFHGCMRYMVRDAEQGGLVQNPEALLEYFDWESKGDGLVVDVGGAHGEISGIIARRHKKLRFIVQDLAPVVAEGRKMLSTNVPNQQDASRISFQDHSYFSPQPDLGHVDVFYFRAIMHNNNDTMVIRIIENLLPAMKKGTRILIEDMVLPPANTIPRFLEKLLRSLDMQMMCLLGAKERSADDWQKLVARMDRRLKIIRILTPTDCLNGLVEIGLEDEGLGEEEVVGAGAASN